MQIWALETCYQDISKIIKASCFKHGQLVEDDEWITWLKFKKKVIIFFYVNVGIENFNKDTCISKHFIDSSFKLCELITGYNYFYFSSN